jgi:hypothetical protein
MPRFVSVPSLSLAGFLALLLGLSACDQMGDPHPDQPIHFSHATHAEQNQIACMYCHYTADKSPAASVPSVATCMNCHAYVAREHPEVVKLTEYWERGEPIPWNKVHDQPDFVYFPHQNHVRFFLEKHADAGPFEAQRKACAECHGDVWTFDTGKRVEPLNMGWCLNCHKAEVKAAPEEIEAHRYAQLVDCLVCHK